MNFNIFQWRSITTRVTLLTLIIFMASVWALTFYISKILHEDMQRVLSAQQFSTASYVAAEVNYELNDRMNALNSIAEQITPAVLGNTAALQALIEQRPILASLFTGSVWVSRQDGIAIASLMPELIGTSYADREYLITVLKEGKPAISKPITGKIMRDAIIVMAVPIHDQQGQVIGALAGVTDLGRPSFLNQITEGRYGKTGHYFIVDTKHRMIITSTDKSRIMQPLPAAGVNPMIDRFVQGYEGSAVLINAVGKEVLSSSKLIPLTGWAVSISLPTAEAFAPIHEMEQRTLHILIILTVLAGCLIWLVISRTLQHQLSPVIVASRKLAAMCDSDQTPQLLPVTRQDEIGELIRGFNQLIETLGKREQALIKSEERLHRLVESIGEGIILQDASERILLWNKTASEIFGLDADRITGKPAVGHDLATIKEDGAPFLVQDHPSLHTLRTGQPCSGIIMGVIRHERETRWLKVNTRPLFTDEEPNPYAVIISFSDITERKKYEETLRESEQNLRTLSNSGMALIWTSGTDKLCNYFNSVWLEFTGRTLEQEIGNGWAEGIHPDDFQRCQDIYFGSFDRHEPFSMEYRLRRHDGEYRWIVDEGCPRYDSHGNFIGYIGHCLDITDRKRAEEDLREALAERRLAELRYRTLFNKMLDGFALHEIIVDDKGIPVNYRFLAVNPAFERITGLKAVDIIGHTVLDIMPDTEMRWIETYGRVALTGEPVHLEDYTDALQKHFEITAFRPAPGQFACIIIDITEKKQASEERQKLHAQLQQAQKLEAIGTLAGGIAHDFNNILGAIVGYSEMIRDDLPPGSSSVKDINEVLKASHRAKALVKQILAFSRQADNQKIPIHPAVIVKEAITLLRSSLPTTITIKQDIERESGIILADPTQIHQIVMNLATNAFHAMEVKGGILTISLQKKILSQYDLVTEPGLQPGTFVQLSIRDTGEGIAPEIRDRIFDPFFTTKEVGKGTGLGLSMVYSIVKSCNGSIACSSQLGEGSEFRILIPVLEGNVVQEKGSTDPAPHGKEHILLIDDEEMLVGLGQTMLERLGYHVTTTTSSFDALTIFKNQPDTFDLIITDQTMPGITGFDLARRILQIRPHMPIILCTGYSTLISEAQAKAAGIKGFAYKPLAKKEISELIRKVLEEENA